MPHQDRAIAILAAMKTVIINQARMTSTRLPGKVLKEVMGKPLLEYQLERLKRVQLADEVVVATTTKETDDPIVELCDRLSVQLFRGSEDDVLSRCFNAAKEQVADVVVRVTSDCPLIDPMVVDQTIQYYLNHQPDIDYASNSLERTYPRGMDAEVFSFKALQTAFYEATAQPDREHVTSFIYRHPQRFHLSSVAYHCNQSQHRWTVDTSEDFELIRLILEALYSENPAFTLEDTLALLDKHPDWMTINAHIEQKTYGE